MLVLLLGRLVTGATSYCSYKKCNRGTARETPYASTNLGYPIVLRAGQARSFLPVRCKSWCVESLYALAHPSEIIIKKAALVHSGQ